MEQKQQKQKKTYIMEQRHRINKLEQIHFFANELSFLPEAENMEYILKLTVDEIFDIFSKEFRNFVPFNYKAGNVTFRIELQK